MNETKVKRDAYFVLHVTVPSGFEFKIPARGYSLKSWLAFETRLGSDVVVEETTAAVYEHLILGDPLDPLGELINGPADKRETKRKTAPKRDSGKAKAKDSKSARTPRKTAASASKEKPTVVRKSPVRNVRKPKESVQGTNNPRKATPSRSRKPKGSTQ